MIFQTSTVFTTKRVTTVALQGERMPALYQIPPSLWVFSPTLALQFNHVRQVVAVVHNPTCIWQ